MDKGKINPRLSVADAKKAAEGIREEAEGASPATQIHKKDVSQLAYMQAIEEDLSEIARDKGINNYILRDISNHTKSISESLESIDASLRIIAKRDN